MASAAPSFLAAHQEGGTVQRLAAGMRDDDGEYKVSYLIFLFCNNINVLLHTCCLFMTMLFLVFLFSPFPSRLKSVGWAVSTFYSFIGRKLSRDYVVLCRDVVWCLELMPSSFCSIPFVYFFLFKNKIKSLAVPRNWFTALRFGLSPFCGGRFLYR